MKKRLLSFSLLFVPLTLLIGCVSSDPPSSGTTAGGPPAAPPTVASPTKEAAPSAKITNPAFSHKSTRDTVDWKTTNIIGLVPVVKETDREWPGERLGLIGPIVAKGGPVGSKSYVTVYDPAGVLVGGLTYKEYKQSPQRLIELLKKAQLRAEHQNLMSLRYLIQKRQAAQMAAKHKKQGGSHENQ